MLTMSVELAGHNHSLMRRIATDGVACAVCLCARYVDKHFKTAEPIEMPFASDGPT